MNIRMIPKILFKVIGRVFFIGGIATLFGAGGTEDIKTIALCGVIGLACVGLGCLMMHYEND